MRSRDAAVLATCLRALGMQQGGVIELPPGPDAEWAAEPPDGSLQSEEMEMVQELMASCGKHSEIAFRDDMCRVQVNSAMLGPILRSEILFQVVDKITVTVTVVMFARRRYRLNKQMTADDLLFYVRWCMLIDNSGTLLTANDEARGWLKRVRDWSEETGKLRFYVYDGWQCAMQPPGHVHFCICRKGDGMVAHLFMQLAVTGTNPLQIIRADRLYKAGDTQIAVYTTESEMLGFLLDTANHSSEPQARGASSADTDREPPKRTREDEEPWRVLPRQQDPLP